MNPPDRTLRLLIVVVVYRVADLAIECLRSLMDEVRSLDGVHVAVCENGSGPEVAARLRQTIKEEGWTDRVWLREIKANRGFTGGNNAIIDLALGWPNPPAAFLLLNSDTLARRGSLHHLIEAMDRYPKAGVIGPAITDPNGRLQTSCFRDPTPFSELLRAASTGPFDRVFWRRLVSKRPPHDSGPHEWTSFAAAVIRREPLSQVGTFDEGFFLYFDDPDLCYRIRQAGWEIRHCKEASIVHLEGAANEVPASVRERRRLPRYYYVSRTRYFVKRHGIAGLWLANLCWHAGRTISWARELIERRPSHLPKSQWRDIWTNALRPWHAPHLPFPALGSEPEPGRSEAETEAILHTS